MREGAGTTSYEIGALETNQDRDAAVFGKQFIFGDRDYLVYSARLVSERAGKEEAGLFSSGAACCMQESTVVFVLITYNALGRAGMRTSSGAG